MSDRDSERTTEYQRREDGTLVRVYVSRNRNALRNPGEQDPSIPRSRGDAQIPSQRRRRESDASRGSSGPQPPLLTQERRPSGSSVHQTAYLGRSPSVDSHYTLSSINPRHASTTSGQPAEYSRLAVFTEDESNPRTYSSRISQPMPQRDEFTSELPPVGRSFVTIDVGDYSGCEKFMQKNPTVFSLKDSNLLREATAALLVQKDAYAKCCVQQALLLRKTKEMSTKERRSFFSSLIKRNREIVREFLSERDDVMKYLRSQIEQRTTSQSSYITENIANLSISPSETRHQENLAPPNLAHGDGRARHDPAAPDPGPPVQPSSIPRRTPSEASNGPTYLGPNQVIETLDKRYYVRPNGKTFFTFGRVFAILWHASPGVPRIDPKRKDWMRTVRFQEPVISHIQRMAVVKEDHGFAWCIPINTYNGQGLAKPGFNDRDIQAHAIIHLEGTQPEFAPTEPRTNKRSIAVKPASDDQLLDCMSRIHFGKVHTVEHNIKVMNVGNINMPSLEFFETYWRNKSSEPSRYDRRR